MIPTAPRASSRKNSLWQAPSSWRPHMQQPCLRVPLLLLIVSFFPGYITRALSSHPFIEIKREEVTEIPQNTAILATGPLTSAPMADSLAALIEGEYLYFYDAIAPILEAESIDYAKVYRASRYGKGSDDYLNCPMTKDEMRGFTGNSSRRTASRRNLSRSNASSRAACLLRLWLPGVRTPCGLAP